MEQITIDRLLKAGWTNGRNIDIGIIEEKMKKMNINLPKNVKTFLSEYGMLEIEFKKAIKSSYMVEIMEFNPIKAVGDAFDGEYFKDIFDEYEVDELVYPIGNANRGNLLMLMSENGNFYRYTNGFLCKDGETIEEMLDCVVGGCRQPIYLD